MKLLGLKKRTLMSAQGSFADQFKCGKTKIQAIFLKKDEILKDYASNLNGNIKRVRGPQYEEIDKAMLDWFRKACCKKKLQELQ